GVQPRLHAEPILEAEMCRGERRVTAEIDLDHGCEPAKSEIRVGERLADDKPRSGDVRLACHRRHPLVGWRVIQQEHSRGVSGERPVRKRVHRPQPHLGHASKLTHRCFESKASVERLLEELSRPYEKRPRRAASRSEGKLTARRRAAIQMWAAAPQPGCGFLSEHVVAWKGRSAYP